MPRFVSPVLAHGMAVTALQDPQPGPWTMNRYDDPMLTAKEFLLALVQGEHSPILTSIQTKTTPESKENGYGSAWPAV